MGWKFPAQMMASAARTADRGAIRTRSAAAAPLRSRTSARNVASTATRQFAIMSVTSTKRPRSSRWIGPDSIRFRELSKWDSGRYARQVAIESTELNFIDNDLEFV